jgi:hypothetical protein
MDNNNKGRTQGDFTVPLSLVRQSPGEVPRWALGVEGGKDAWLPRLLGCASYLLNKVVSTLPQYLSQQPPFGGARRRGQRGKRATPGPLRITPIPRPRYNPVTIALAAQGHTHLMEEAEEEARARDAESNEIE